MREIGIFKSIKNIFSPKANDQSVQLDDILLRALLNGEEITKEKALTLPAVSGAVDFISDIIASMPIKLYKREQGKVTEVERDTRVKCLNGDTGDTLNGFQMKKALVTDYLLDKGGYAVIRRKLNNVTGLFYVKTDYVAPYINADPIYKYANFQIGTQIYESYDVIKLLRNTKDGATGTSVISEISKALETAYQTLLYQLAMVKTGGNKRGFLSSQRKLGSDEITELKRAWRELYANNEENVVVLNNGLEFKEASNNAVETQLNESKLTLKDEINSVFHIHNDFNLTFKEAIYPILKAFESELNNVLLLESEKQSMYFEFDIKEIVKANLLERYQAHEKAINAGWVTINEVRQFENMDSIEGLDVIKNSLGSVMYDIHTHTYYTPNTGEVANGDMAESKEQTTQGG